MTSLENIQNHIYKALVEVEPQVIAIRGDWGTGKTYLWGQCIQHALNKKIIDLNSYAYVSLFGKTSLEALRLECWLEFQRKTFPLSSSNKQPTRMARSNNTSKVIDFISTIHKAADKAITLAVSLMPLNKKIICFDDFERTKLDH